MTARQPNESWFEFVVRFLSEHAKPGGKRVQQAAGLHERGAAGNDPVSVGTGEPQPICRWLDKAADIAEEYSRPCGCTLESISLEYHREFGKSPILDLAVSGREIIGAKRTPIGERAQPPAPNSPEEEDDEYEGGSADSYDKWGDL